MPRGHLGGGQTAGPWHGFDKICVLSQLFWQLKGPIAQINNQGYTGPGAACAFLSLKILGNFFATSLLQVKETHKLLENFATWASKTEAALTLFVSILRWANRNPSPSDSSSLRSRSRSNSINCDIFHSKFGHRACDVTMDCNQGPHKTVLVLGSSRLTRRDDDKMPD